MFDSDDDINGIAPRIDLAAWWNFSVDLDSYGKDTATAKNEVPSSKLLKIKVSPSTTMLSSIWISHSCNNKNNLFHYLDQTEIIVMILDQEKGK